jgi:hypothetical protein
VQPRETVLWNRHRKLVSNDGLVEQLLLRQSVGAQQMAIEAFPLWMWKTASADLPVRSQISLRLNFLP